MSLVRMPTFRHPTYAHVHRVCQPRLIGQLPEKRAVAADRGVQRVPVRSLDALEQLRRDHDTGLADRTLPRPDDPTTHDDDGLEDTTTRVHTRRVLRVEDVGAITIGDG